MPLRIMYSTTYCRYNVMLRLLAGGRKVKENAVTSGDGGKSSACCALVKKHRDLFFRYQTEVHPALDTDLGVLPVAVNEKFPRIRAAAMTTCWHVAPPFQPTACDSSTIRWYGQKIGDEVLSFLRTNGFRVELNAVNRKRWVMHTHDEA